MWGTVTLTALDRAFLSALLDHDGCIARICRRSRGDALLALGIASGSVAVNWAEHEPLGSLPPIEEMGYSRAQSHGQVQLAVRAMLAGVLAA